VSGSSLAREFRDRGFVVVRGLLPPEAAEEKVRELERLSGRTRQDFERFRVGKRWLRRGVYRGWTLPDGVSKTRSFWDLVSCRDSSTSCARCSRRRPAFSSTRTSTSASPR
jgi:hypothetical protein